MTMQDNSTTTNTTQDNPQQQPQTGAENIDSIRAEQWQEFMNNMAAQNQALTAELGQTRNALTAVQQQQRKQELDQLTPEQRAERLQTELDTIRNTATVAYQQQVSQDVWRQRDAESAARILRLHNIKVNDAGLYHGPWDQNWMPRFTASVEQIVAQRGQTRANTTTSEPNPGNRANVGTGTGSTIPEIDSNADGPSTIRFALQKLAEGRT